MNLDTWLFVVCLVLTGYSPVQATPSNGLDCDFEQDTCAWQQAPQEELTWERHKGQVGSWVTGPSSDHTYGTGRGHYIALSTMKKPTTATATTATITATTASKANTKLTNKKTMTVKTRNSQASTPLTVQRSSLMSAVLDATRNSDVTGCLTFWYFMYGSNVGRLDLFVSHANPSFGPRRKLWSTSGTQGPRWKPAYVQLPSDWDRFFVVFEVTDAANGRLPAVHAAIDDVSAKKGACTSSASCDFENGPCGYLPDAVGNWTVVTPSTTVAGENGRLAKFSSDHTLRSKDGGGHFLFLDIKSSWQFGGIKEDLFLKTLLKNAESQSCLYFWYNVKSQTHHLEEEFIKHWLGRNATVAIPRDKDAWRLAWMRPDSSSSSSSDLQGFFSKYQNAHVQIGLDDIRLVPEICPDVDAVCDFEDAPCSWQNTYDEGEDDFDWMVARGGNLYTVTNARIDHTLRTVDGKYLLLDSNTPGMTGRTARLLSRWMDGGSLHCLSLWYLMDGSQGSKINVWLSSSVETPSPSSDDDDDDDNDKRFLASLGGDDEDSPSSHSVKSPSYLWKELRLTIPPQSGPFQIVIEGVVGEEFKSDVAIDDVFIRTGSCLSDNASSEAIPAKYAFQCGRPLRSRKLLTYGELCDFNEDCPQGEEEKSCGYNCDFEKSQCKWTDDSSGSGFWRLTNGLLGNEATTTKPLMGVVRDHTTFTDKGHFMAVSDSPSYSIVKDGVGSVLKSPFLKRSGHECTMLFYYLVTKPGGWHLSVDREVRGMAFTHLRLANVTARYWRRVMVKLGHSSEPFRVAIRASNSNGSSGTIAVDDISFRGCNFPQPGSSCGYWSKFKCHNDVCLNSDRVCDFVDDCGDGTDESDETCVDHTRCDFQNGLADWTQEEQDDSFDWSLVESATSPIPMPDHTTEFSDGAFLLITGNSRLDGDQAALVSPVLEPTQHCTMTLHLAMNGSHSVQLRVNTRRVWDRSLTHKTHVLTQGTTAYWRPESVSFVSDDPFQIVLMGIIGQGVDQYIAVDDVSLSPECRVSTETVSTMPPSTLDPESNPCGDSSQWQCLDGSRCIPAFARCDFMPHCDDASDEAECGACDFESSRCGWMDVSSGKYRWEVRNHSLFDSSSSSLSSNPSYKGGYQSSTSATDDNAAMTLHDSGSTYVRPSLLKSPQLGSTQPTCRVAFKFFNKGSGELSLYAYPSDVRNYESAPGGSRLWHFKETTTSHWRKVSVEIGSLATGFVLVFRYDYKEPRDLIALALDDVTFSQSCDSDSLPCDFECHGDNHGRCVDSSQVCDAAYDCRHGDDETRCGEYRRLDFELELEQDGGLGVGWGFGFDANGDFSWERMSWEEGGGISEASAYPERDHSLGTRQGHYLAIPLPASDTIPVGIVERARIKGPVFYPSHANQGCVIRFYFHVGRDEDKDDIVLYTQTHQDGELSRIWSSQGYVSVVGALWFRASVTLESQLAFRVVLEGTRRAGYRGVNAIDDISFTPECIDTKLPELQILPPFVNPGSCLEGKEFTCDYGCMALERLCDFRSDCDDGTDEAYCPSSCDFEGGSMCSWTSEALWKMGFSDFYEHPDHSSEGEDMNGHFLVAESHGETETLAKLSSTIFRKSGPNCAVSFWYKVLDSLKSNTKKASGVRKQSKRNDAQGKKTSIKASTVAMSVVLVREGYSQVLSIENLDVKAMTNSDDEWLHRVVSLPPCLGQFQVSIEAKFTSSHAKVFIDDLTLEDCEDQAEDQLDDEGRCNGDNHFLCGDGTRCIPREQLCDLRRDCCDGSDEGDESCDDYTTTTFESGLQGWTQAVGLDGVWLVMRATDKEEGDDDDDDDGLPFQDHTHYSPTGRILTAFDVSRSSRSRSRSKYHPDVIRAALVKEMPSTSESPLACRVTFWYQINGEDTNATSLSVSVRKRRGDGEGSEVLRNVTRKNRDNNAWIKESLTIHVQEPYLLTFEATQSSDSSSRVSIDDIVFSPGCQSQHGDDKPISYERPTPTPAPSAVSNPDIGANTTRIEEDTTSVASTSDLETSETSNAHPTSTSKEEMTSHNVTTTESSIDATSDATQETARSSASCSSDEFRCRENGRCIDVKRRCDFLKDCSAGSDEKVCSTLNECEFNFEDTCHWFNSNSTSSVNWKTTAASRPVPKYAPETDANMHRHTPGHYIYIDGINRTEFYSPQPLPTLSSPILSVTGPSCSLEFYHVALSHTNGSSFSLAIYSVDVNDNTVWKSTTLWISRQSSREWTYTRVGIGRQWAPFRLSFLVASTDGDWRGLVALDKIRYLDCSLPPLSTTATKDSTDRTLCRDGAVTCEDGGCVDESDLCDIKADCRDASDESVAICKDVCVYDFEQSASVSAFENYGLRDGKPGWELWNSSMVALMERTIGVDHTLNSARGHFLFVQASVTEKALILSSTMKASNASQEICKVSFYALVPNYGQSLKAGYMIIGDSRPTWSLDISPKRVGSDSFWHKFSFDIEATDAFQLTFSAKLLHGVSVDDVIGVDDVIIGPGCRPEVCPNRDDRQANYQPAVSSASQERRERVKAGKTNLLVPIAATILGLLALTVIVTGILLYLRNVQIIGKPSKWGPRKETRKSKSKSKNASFRYWHMDETGSLDGEMFERSSVSI